MYIKSKLFQLLLSMNHIPSSSADSVLVEADDEWFDSDSVSLSLSSLASSTLSTTPSFLLLKAAACGGLADLVSPAAFGGQWPT